MLYVIIVIFPDRWNWKYSCTTNFSIWIIYNVCMFNTRYGPVSEIGPIFNHQRDNFFHQMSLKMNALIYILNYICTVMNKVQRFVKSFDYLWSSLFFFFFFCLFEIKINYHCEWLTFSFSHCCRAAGKFSWDLWLWNDDG